MERERGAPLDLERYSVADSIQNPEPNRPLFFMSMLAHNHAFDLDTTRHLLQILASLFKVSDLCSGSSWAHRLKIKAIISSGILFTGTLAFLTKEIRRRTSVTLEWSFDATWNECHCSMKNVKGTRRPYLEICVRETRKNVRSLQNVEPRKTNSASRFLILYSRAPKASFTAGIAIQIPRWMVSLNSDPPSIIKLGFVEG